MQKNLINEIFILRTFACMSILLLHSLARGFLDENDMVTMFSLLLTFGTPTFVFISEFILSRTYRDSLPSAFWSKRVKYVILPYLIFGTFYAIVKGFEQTLVTGEPFIQAAGQLWWRHLLLGDFHGYFILVILQFYVLHYFLDKYLKNMNPIKVICTCLVINLLYLGFFNFVQPYPNEIGIYIWEKFYWIPFLGWIFYFSIAYYCGRYYSTFINQLKKHSKIVILAPLLLGVACIYLYETNIITSFSSKRIDMLFFSTSLIISLYYLSLKIRQVPKIIILISQFSFGIYLFHPLFMAIMAIGFNLIPWIADPITKTISYFMGSLVLSIISTYLFNRIPYGHFFSGKIGVGLKPIKQSKTVPIPPKTAEGKI
ncbi:acyltransferase family protein [Metabacillus idriensis]|uniref:Acyltransferase family protein n=1 Tax=Metabacillus idriensis TaxID=324768 RepID=A0A6I2MGX6_9BACI|nr:acyltransferase family protein [Metabacillus idriensis]MCM3598335.1 acyltransferase family protein [Metabacillus idriensis]MRX55043.1 acyltransferase family protein [Metabacillus idriensis]OHR71609.1 hypothetical protein HMPREF3291_23970 [Bacillus sp. HMSC76G11]